MAVNGNPSESKKQRRRSGIIYSTVLNRTPLPALAFTQTSPWGLASFLFSPLIGQVFRRECRIGGASEFTPSSTVVLQSKSCADPLPSLPPLRFHPPFLPPPAIVHFARAKNRLSRPFLYFQRSQTTSRSPWFDERHDDRPRDDRIQFRSAGRNRIGRSVGSKIMLPAWPLYLRSTPHHVGPRFVTLHARDPVHLPPDKGYPMIR